MKKVLLLLSVFVAITTLSAQDMEYLQLRHIDADPMKRTTAVNQWYGKSVAINIPEDDNTFPSITIKCHEHIFTGKDTRIGLYNENDSLVHMSQYVSAKKVRGSQFMMIYNSVFPDSVPGGEFREYCFTYKNCWSVKAPTILKWLQSGNGYVRIVTEQYGAELYDVRFKLKK